MATGYGASLLYGDADRLLVSFVEFSKKPDQQLAVRDMPQPYVIPTKTADTPTKPGRDAEAFERIDHGTAFGSMVDNHSAEIFDEPDQPTPRRKLT